MRETDGRAAAPEAPEAPPAARRGAVVPEFERRPRGSSGRRSLGFGALLVLAAGLAIGVQQHYRQHLEVAAAAAEQRDFVPRVRVALVEVSPHIRRVSLPATTTAFEAANIFARASGYIVQRDVDIGSRVRAGQLLAVISAPELDHQIAEAQATLAQNAASLRQTQANRELAAHNWARDAVLVRQGWVTRQQGDTDRLNLAALTQAADAGAATVKAQQAQIQVLEQQKAYQRVVAPFDGVITQRNVDVGSLVQADATSGTFLFALAHGNVMRIQLFVPQEAAQGVAPGVAAIVRVPEIPDHPFFGKVTRIADALDPATRTLLTEIDVPNPKGELSPGMYTTVELEIPRRTPSLIVPDAAVVFDAQGLYVFAVENGVVHQRKITEIRDLGTEAEVDSGVRAGDRVVVNPPVDLEDGNKVKIRGAAAAGAAAKKA
jgi:RND family efflux transporter MFP subunit